MVNTDVVRITIREFAAEQLAASGEAEAIVARHRAEIVRLVEALTPLLSGDAQRRWLGRLERDHDNIRAVLDRAVAGADAPTAIRIGFAMWRYWQKRGHLAEARRRLQAMADAPWSHDDPRLRARLMEALGGVCWWQADIVAMGLAYAEALRIWEELGDKREIANALYNDSFRYAVSESPGDRDPERLGYQQMHRARDLAAEAGDERGRANALWGIGNWLYFHDADDHGISQFEEAVDVFHRLGDRTMEAWSHHMLGTALIQPGGSLDAARGHVETAMRLFQGFGDVAGLTLTLDDFASIAIAAGDLPRAAKLWGAARALSAAGGVGLADFVDTRFEFYGRPSTRERMDPAELERLAEQGRRMTLDESVAYALQVDIDALAPHDHAGVAR
jgi:hypothetical protein